MEKIIFKGEAGENLELYVMESTRLAGRDYILAADVQTGDGTCYILREAEQAADSESEESVYEMVEDEKELDYLLSVFAELVEDADFEF